MKKNIVIVMFIIVAVLGIMTLTSCKQNDDKNKTSATAVPALTAQPDANDPGNTFEYTISGCITDNMVVQRDNYVNVWGWSNKANEGGYIYGEFMGETRYAQVNKYGEWHIQFSPHEASKETQSLKVYTKTGASYEYKDILVGDVYYIVGQSNAELVFSTTINENPEVVNEISENDNIRIFRQSTDDIEGKTAFAQVDVMNPEYCWQKTTYDTLENFSALGYYFAKEVSNHVDVPLGVVHMAWGGMEFRQFCSAEFGSTLGLTGSLVYNTMMSPFLNMPFAGMIFYQGESDNDSFELYDDWLTAWVTQMRKEFNCNFAFYNVQLSSHYPSDNILNSFPYLAAQRSTQVLAYEKIENSYLITSMDLGSFDPADPDLAHPKKKKPLGERIAAIALADTYGVDGYDINYVSCPVPTSVKWKSDYVLVNFNFVGSGLKLSVGDKLLGFELVRDDKTVVGTLDAEIVGKNQVKIYLPDDLKRADYIGYGMSMICPIEGYNLCNSEGVPALSFRYELPSEE